MATNCRSRRNRHSLLHFHQHHHHHHHQRRHQTFQIQTQSRLHEHHRHFQFRTQTLIHAQTQTQTQTQTQNRTQNLYQTHLVTCRTLNHNPTPAGASSVASDLTHRSSLTLLAVPNPYLSAASDSTSHLSPSSLSDVLRYHVLLEYFSWSDLHLIPASGKLVTTLFQTTGRATSNLGSVNITRNPLNGVVSIHSPAPYSSPPNATVLSLIKTFPYNVSIFAVDALLVPFGFDLTTSETRPPPLVNITQALIDGHNFYVAASLLTASGVVDEFQTDEGGAGITLFVPTDAAFSILPVTEKLQSLPADKKAVVLKFHVLHSYYPLGSLESIVNPLQPTLATEAMGAGSFTLNISKINGSVAIDTGILQASVTQTVFDQNPVAIFGVSKVLLPREIFGTNPAVTTKPGGGAVTANAQPPEISLAPENSPGFSGPPPGFRKEIRSEAGVNCVQRFAIALCCIGLYLLFSGMRF